MESNTNAYTPPKKTKKAPDLFITAALPYSNGPLHIGHMLEYVQADAKARFARLRGQQVLFVCADDNHGTPVELKASNLGVSPETLVQTMRIEHERDFARYAISFDHYHQTHSDENRELCEEIFEALRQGGHIVERDVTQLYDTAAGRFLSDRHVMGSCPHCRASDQYGDVCEICGATYDATDLIEPKSVLSEGRPELRKSLHYFFRLKNFESFLRQWKENGHLQAPVAASLEDWFSSGLRDWDVSRDAPYFGFQIPGTTDKFFYVWLDAPLGYIATLENYCRQHGGSWRDIWEPGSHTEIQHFIGKDIAYFHACFWPAVLEGAGLRTPTRISCHGFLTVDGRKMSKSRGTYVSAAELAKQVDPDLVRFYLLSLLDGGIVDVNFSHKDLVARVNADLVCTVINIASRCCALLERVADRQLADKLDCPAMYEYLLIESRNISADYEVHDTAAAIRRILTLAAEVNRYIDTEAPWRCTENPCRVRTVVTQGLMHFRALMILLQPCTPALCTRALALFDEGRSSVVPLTELAHPPFGKQLVPYRALLTRLEPRFDTDRVAIHNHP